MSTKRTESVKFSQTIRLNASTKEMRVRVTEGESESDRETGRDEPNSTSTTSDESCHAMERPSAVSVAAICMSHVFYLKLSNYPYR